MCGCVHRELSGMQGGVGVVVTVRAHWADYEFAAKMQTSAIELWVCCVRFALSLSSLLFSFCLFHLRFDFQLANSPGLVLWGVGTIGQAVNALNFCAKCNCILFHVPSSAGALCFLFPILYAPIFSTAHWAPLRPLPIFDCFIIYRVGHMRCERGMKYQRNKLKSQQTH